MTAHPAASDEYMRLVALNRKLTDALSEVRVQMAALWPHTAVDYRIALRPDDSKADPMDHRTVLDDIVVARPTLFRAEQMSTKNWWVACFLDDDTGDEIVWSVTAKSKPLRIEWVTTQFPAAASYEHEGRTK